MTVLKKSTLGAAGVAFILMAVMFSGCPVSYTPNVPLNNESDVVKPTIPPGSGTIQPTGISFFGNPNIVVLNTSNTSVTLTAQVLPDTATTRVVYWSSQNPQIATFIEFNDGTGVPKATVTPIGVGSTKVYATIQDDDGNQFTATCTIQVDAVPSKGIQIGGSGLDSSGRLVFVTIGDEKYIDAKVLFGNSPSVTWSLAPSTPAIIELNSTPWNTPPTSTSGQLVMVKALTEGEASLTATNANGESDTILVRVGAAKIEKVDIVTMTDNVVTSLTIPVRLNSTLVTAKLTPVINGFDNVTWKIISDTAGVDVVVIVENGMEMTSTKSRAGVPVSLKALTAGTAILRATADDDTFTDCAIRVPLTINPAGLVLIRDSASLNTQILTASTTPDVTWTIAPSTGIATITKNSATGALTVTGVSSGLATITATTAWLDGDGNPLTAVCPVTVMDTFSGVTYIRNLPIQRPAPVPATPTPTGPLTITASSSTTTWRNSDPTVADWAPAGSTVTGVSVTLTAMDTGRTFVTAENADGSLYQVYQVTVPLRFEYTSRTIEKGVTEQLYTTLPYTFAASGSSWSTSNTAVATVDDLGRVTALSAGTAVITAGYKGVTAECVVTVPLTINPGALMLYLDSPGLYDRRTLSSTIAYGQAEWSTNNAAIFSSFNTNPDGTLTLIGGYVGEALITVATLYDGATGVPITPSSPGTPVTAQCVVRVEEHLGQVVTLNAPLNYQGTTPPTPQPTPPPIYQDLPPPFGQPGAATVPPGSIWHINDMNVAVLSVPGVPGTTDTVTGQALTVTAVGAGTTSLTVTDINGNLVTQYLINVPLRLEKSSVVIDLATGETLYTTMPTANQAAIAWTSDDSTIATVDAAGTVYGVVPGRTSVHAEYPRGSGNFFDCDVSVRLTSPMVLYVDEVKEPPINGMWLPLFPATIWAVQTGGTFVSVEQDGGKMTGLNATLGTSARVVAYTNGELVVDCPVEVLPRILTVNAPSITLYAGSSTVAGTGTAGSPTDVEVNFVPPYYPTPGHPEHLPEPALHWTSSNHAQATMSPVLTTSTSAKGQTARVTGVSPTTPLVPVKVTATGARGETVSCDVTVVPEPAHKLEIRARLSTANWDTTDWNGKTFYGGGNRQVELQGVFTPWPANATHLVWEFAQPEGNVKTAIHDRNNIAELDTALTTGGASPGVPQAASTTLKINLGTTKGTVRIHVYTVDPTTDIRGADEGFIVIFVGDLAATYITADRKVEVWIDSDSSSNPTWSVQNSTMASISNITHTERTGNLVKATITLRGLKAGTTTLSANVTPYPTGFAPVTGAAGQPYTVSFRLDVIPTTRWYVSSTGANSNSGFEITDPIPFSAVMTRITSWYTNSTYKYEWPDYGTVAEQPAEIYFMDNVSTGLLAYTPTSLPKNLGLTGRSTVNITGTVRISGAVVATLRDITLVGSVIVDSASQFAMRSGKIQNTGGTAGVQVGGNAEFIMSGGTITSNTIGVSQASTGRFYMTSGTIQNTGGTAGVHVSGNAEFNMSGGSITSSTLGVNLASTGRLVMTGTTARITGSPNAVKNNNPPGTGLNTGLSSATVSAPWSAY
ncbi:hypothetical protein AGMMS50267_03050 [Spirochaetia bacterium]|nr:hypothetical protein AGMMS50267_03050 [Spirochaetia bacterium]